MAEEGERGQGVAVRRGEGQVEENERNQEKSKWSNGPIMTQPNDPAQVSLAIHAACAGSDDPGCRAPTMKSFKLPATSSCSEEHLDVFRQKPVRITVKVNVPVTEHPKVNIFY